MKSTVHFFGLTYKGRKYSNGFSYDFFTGQYQDVEVYYDSHFKQAHCIIRQKNGVVEYYSKFQNFTLTLGKGAYTMSFGYNFSDFKITSPKKKRKVG